jgi:3-phosphoshikimate 1-carboxyvinyltransferase
MQLTLTPGTPLSGAIQPGGPIALPGDKSLSHRAALFAALADGQSHIGNFLVAGVTKAMLEALTALGVSWELIGTSLVVEGNGPEGFHSPAYPLNCGNSATTLRLLAGALAAVGVEAELDGSSGLRGRPMRRIVEPLQRMGVPITASPQGTAPLHLLRRPAGQRLRGIDYSLPVASAQVKTCLLLAALAADGPTILHEPGPSRDHTERVLRSMGINVATSRGEYYETRLTPLEPWSLRPLQIELPGDISAAAFLIVAALIVPGSDITLKGIGLNPNRTGLLDALVSMGGKIEIISISERNGEPVGELRVRSSRLIGAHVAGPLVVRMIDEFPALAVAALCAEGVTTVSDASELRTKESDRISALCVELRKLGSKVTETPDGFVIRGGVPVHGNVVESHGDHRLAMALAVAGLVAQDFVTVQGAEILSESFPGFVSAIQALGAIVALEE